MTDTRREWEGLRIAVYETDTRGTFRVVFYPTLAQGPREPEPAAVVVRAGAQPEVVGYTPPEVELPGLSRDDYERRAVEAVPGLPVSRET